MLELENVYYFFSNPTPCEQSQHILLSLSIMKFVSQQAIYPCRMGDETKKKMLRNNNNSLSLYSTWVWGRVASSRVYHVIQEISFSNHEEANVIYSKFETLNRK